VICVVGHLWHWGPRGYWCVLNTGSKGGLDQVHGDFWDGGHGGWVVAKIVM